MKKINVLLSILAIVAISSCGKNSGYKETEEGVSYKILKEGDSDVKPREGDYIWIKSVIIAENDGKDTVIYDSRKYPQEGPILISKPLFKGDVFDAFKSMNLHDSTEFLFISDTLIKYQEGNFPKNINSGSKIKIIVKLDSITTKEKVQKMQAQYMADMQKSEQKEQDTLQKYLVDHKITTKPTASGLYYIELKKGSGKQAVAGSVVKVNYTGSLLNGRVFDSSIESVAKKYSLDVIQKGRKYEPIEFELGRDQIIQGWHEAIAMMKEGGKAKLIIPSKLAYGPYPQGDIISPFSTLIFEVELVKVGK